MTWVAWRQFRLQAAIATAATVAVIVTLWATRAHITNTDLDQLGTGYDTLKLLGTVLIGVPAAIGAFWGAPLLAREFEAGTYRFAWTQSVTPSRWLTIKLAVIAAATVAVTAAFSWAFTWWSLPFDAVGGRIGTATFGQRGITPVAYAVFALALGAFIGTVIRRTLPAMATALVVFFVTRFSVQLWIRPHLLPAQTITRPSAMFSGSASTTDGGTAWVLSSRTVDAAGRTFDPSSTSANNLLAQTCNLTRASADRAWSACVDKAGIRDIISVQPAKHFWALQALESSIFIALAIALVAATFWWLHHRTR
ncbi:MAG TPA: hypothetical protein PLS63_02555 [Microthrixaceae bacterium]|nr:hypothetical protein [Microthrixaceae bacterium]